MIVLFVTFGVYAALFRFVVPVCIPSVMIETLLTATGVIAPVETSTDPNVPSAGAADVSFITYVLDSVPESDCWNARMGSPVGSTAMRGSVSFPVVRMIFCHARPPCCAPAAAYLATKTSVSVPAAPTFLVVPVT